MRWTLNDRSSARNETLPPLLFYSFLLLLLSFGTDENDVTAHSGLCMRLRACHEPIILLHVKKKRRILYLNLGSCPPLLFSVVDFWSVSPPTDY